MKKILFPTKFANHAPEIFKYALELAYQFDAKLVMLHAISDPEKKLANQKELLKSADKAMDSMVEFVSAYTPNVYTNKVKIEYITDPRTAAEAILSSVSLGIDLIVMGMTGKTTMLDRMIGITTLEILNKSDCPVLMVPSKATFEGIDNIVMTTNFEFRDFSTINYLKKWISTLNANLHCIHVIENDINEDKAKHLMKIIRTTYKKHKQIFCDLYKGQFRAEIEKIAHHKKADLLAMSASKRNLIDRLIISQSAVEEIAPGIRIPLLVIKDPIFEKNSKLEQWAGLGDNLNA